MDYGKTLFEVWKDVVMFKNSDRSASQSDILQFARLVMSMLGGPGIATEEELKKEGALHVHKALKRGNPGVLRVPVLLRGMIIHLGPTNDEIFSNLKKVDELTFSLNEGISERLLPSVYEENESFLQLLDELDEADLKRIYNFDRHMSFEYEPNPAEIYEIGSYFSLV